MDGLRVPDRIGKHWAVEGEMTACTFPNVTDIQPGFCSVSCFSCPDGGRQRLENRETACEVGVWGKKSLYFCDSVSLLWRQIGWEMCRLQADGAVNGK